MRVSEDRRSGVLKNLETVLGFTCAIIATSFIDTFFFIVSQFLFNYFGIAAPGSNQLRQNIFRTTTALPPATILTWNKQYTNTLIRAMYCSLPDRKNQASKCKIK
jgi:hypothetical protein